MKLEVSIKAETLFHIGPIPITNSMLTMFIVMALILLVFSTIARRLQVVPTRGQSVLELIVEFLLGLVEGTAGRRPGRRIFPLIAAIFIFIIFANYTGLLPGVGTIGFYEDKQTPPSATIQVAAIGASAPVSTGAAQAQPEKEQVLVPFLRSPNADLNMTLAMALVTFSVVQWLGISAHGIGGRIKHMADPWWIFPLELVQEFARIISLSFRLFGNIFAGEVLLAVMYAMANAVKLAVVPVLFPVVFLGLELLFGAIQALVFALLTLIYITLAVGDSHDEEHGEAHGTNVAPVHATAQAGD